MPISPQKQVVERYMEGFRRTDRPAILSCLTEDVEWVLPGAFHLRGKAEFDAHIVDPDALPCPAITVTRLVEEGEVVVAEGKVRAGRKDGTVIDLVFCDVFEFAGDRIRKLTSYLMMTP